METFVHRRGPLNAVRAGQSIWPEPMIARVPKPDVTPVLMLKSAQIRQLMDWDFVRIDEAFARRADGQTRTILWRDLKRRAAWRQIRIGAHRIIVGRLAGAGEEA